MLAQVALKFRSLARVVITSAAQIRQQAIALLDQLSESQLVQAVKFLEVLNLAALRSETVADASEEAALVQIIQRRLPAADRSRLDYLRDRNQSGEITDAEHEELLSYVDRIEQQDVDRAAALIELAQRRSIDLKVLVKAFLPTHQSDRLLLGSRSSFG